jgi:hypothetical protein
MHRTDGRPGRASAFVLVVLSLVGAALLLGFTSSARAASSPALFTDPSGDAGAAADIQAVAVSDYHGVVTFSITAPGLQPGTGVSDSFVDTFLDTDRNAETGDFGSDYAMEVGVDGTGTYWGVYRYEKGEWTQAEAPGASLTVSGDTYTFTFGPADVGGSTGFDFWVASTAEDAGTLVATDVAPDGADWWSYDVTTAAPYVPQVGALAGVTTDGSVYVMGEDGMWHWVSAQAFAASHFDWHAIAWYGELYAPIGEPLPAPVTGAVVTAPAPAAAPAELASASVLKAVIAKPTAFPAKPVAGRIFTVNFAVTRSDVGGALTIGKMICDPQINGVVLKHGEQFKDGIASLSFKIPKTAHGKLLKVHLTMNVDGALTSRTATFHIA